MKSTRSVWSILPAMLLGMLIVAGATAEEKKPTAGPKQPIAFAPVKDDPSLARVLLIGDSISIGYTIPVREALSGKVNVHRAPANCGPTIRGLENLDAWLGDEPWDLIHFNWGIHDVVNSGDGHQVPIDDYKKNLAELVGRLKKTGAVLIWCSTTPIADGTERLDNRDVVAYNAVAKKIMDAEKIAIDDLYGFALPELEKIQRPQNCHFLPEGSTALAGQVADAITKALKK